MIIVIVTVIVFQINIATDIKLILIQKRNSGINCPLHKLFTLHIN